MGKGLRSRTKILVAVFVIGVVCLGAAAFTRSALITDSAPDAVFAPVVRGDIEDAVSALGTLEPRDYVDVGAQISGQILALRVDLGQRISEGDLLLEIDPR